MKVTRPVCACCGRCKSSVIFKKEYMEYYCSECLIRLKPVEKAPVYEPVSSTGRRVYHNARGDIVKIEDF